MKLAFDPLAALTWQGAKMHGLATWNLATLLGDAGAPLQNLL